MEVNVEQIQALKDAFVHLASQVDAVLDNRKVDTSATFRAVAESIRAGSTTVDALEKDLATKGFVVAATPEAFVVLKT